MKRFLHRLPLLFVVLLLLTTAVFADMGPKPQLTVVVEHAPSELYYLDLLAEGEYEYDPDFAMDETDLDPELLAAFRAAIPDGWHACIAEGTTGAPIWGKLTGDPAGPTNYHSFRYYGVPETYRILIVTASGETFLSDVLTRRTLQSSVTVDWTAKTAKPPLQSVGYLLQFAATFVPTILIELVVLLLFGFKLKENWKPFLLVNLVTQGGFALYLAVTVLNHGVSGWSLLFYLPIELIITVVESLLYRRLLTERSWERAVGYAIVANVCSATVGLLLIDPLWRFIVSIS